MPNPDDGRAAWDLLVDKDDLSHIELRDRSVHEPGAGEVLLKVDRVGITANNITYARLGDVLSYWDFFPAEEGWGRVPLWGFADVERSKVDGIEEGTRVYGYLPTSSHLIVRAELTSAGFRDVSEHRAALPGPYNIYASTDADTSYDAAHEDLQILYKPLFVTSFMLDDFLADNDFFDASEVLFSSASSKTAYGTGFCTRQRESRPRLVGLTSSSNLEFTESLGCYEQVIAYEDVESLPADTPTVYVDISGSPDLRQTVHRHFSHLAYDAVVGMTHEEASLADSAEVAGPAPTFFFAPDQMRKRRADWGPGEIDRRYAAMWALFVPAVRDWVDVAIGEGPDALADTWSKVESGHVDPRVGHVIAL